MEYSDKFHLGRTTHTIIVPVIYCMLLNAIAIEHRAIEVRVIFRTEKLAMKYNASTTPVPKQ
jgi:hypothetical protein